MEPAEESEDDQVDGVTFVEEFSSGGGGGFSGGGGGFSGGGDAGGGSAGMAEPGAGVPSGVVVDGATGEVVGTASVNTETGTAETTDVDVTVVEEESHPPVSGGSSDEAEPVPAPAEPGDETPNMSPMPHINAAAFVFRDIGPNAQQTNCVPIFFSFRVNGVPATDPISVSTRFTAPRKLRDGRVISAREAAVTSALAAEHTALAVQEALELRQINATQAPPLFRKMLNETFATQGEGFRANQCFPPGGP